MDIDRKTLNVLLREASDDTLEWITTGEDPVGDAAQRELDRRERKEEKKQQTCTAKLKRLAEQAKRLEAELQKEGILDADGPHHSDG